MSNRINKSNAISETKEIDVIRTYEKEGKSFQELFEEYFILLLEKEFSL